MTPTQGLSPPAPAPQKTKGTPLPWRKRVLKALRYALDKLSIYLPVLLMGVFALGTYWLVRTTPEWVGPEPVRAPRHTPDYFLRSFSIKNFDATGRLKNEVMGDFAQHYPDTNILEIKQVHIRAFDAQGHVTVATAQRALSNGDGSEVQLFDQAVVVREAFTDGQGQHVPRMEFRGDFLHVFADTEQVKSHLPVVLIRENSQLTGESLFFDNVRRVLELKGRVQANLQRDPRRSR